MSMISRAQSYLGKTFIGTNSGDKGQCVGLFNQVVLDETGILYPIKNAQTAFQILSAFNAAPAVCQQVVNNPSDPNQLPSVGDWMIWNTSIGQGAGHIACVESVSPNSFVSIDENWVANTVTRQTHNWTGVAGWIHFTANNPTPAPQPPADPCADVKAQNASITAQLASANQTVKDQSVQITQFNAQIDALNKQIKDLQAQLVAAGSDTIHLNALGELLQWFIQRMGLKK